VEPECQVGEFAPVDILNLAPEKLKSKVLILLRQIDFFGAKSSIQMGCG
jgi:hypothetical protein